MTEEVILLKYALSIHEFEQFLQLTDDKICNWRRHQHKGQKYNKEVMKTNHKSKSKYKEHVEQKRESAMERMSLGWKESFNEVFQGNISDIVSSRMEAEREMVRLSPRVFRAVWGELFTDQLRKAPFHVMVTGTFYTCKVDLFDEITNYYFLLCTHY